MIVAGILSPLENALRSVLDWLGPKTLVGAFTPEHATVELAAPVAERVVVDNADNRARPHWTQVPPRPMDP